MKKFIPLVALSLLSLNSIAASKGDTYAGIQYAMTTYSDDRDLEVNPKAIVGRFGKYLKDDFSIEGRLGFGAGDDRVAITDSDFEYKVDTLFGFYGLQHFNISSDSSIYGVLGFSRGELTDSAFGRSRSESEIGSSFSYGIGLNMTIFNIEFMQYINKPDFNISAISFGLTF